MIKYSDAIKNPDILVETKDDTYREKSEKRRVKKNIIKIELAGLAVLFTLAGAAIQKQATKNNEIREGKKIITQKFIDIRNEVKNEQNLTYDSDSDLYRPIGNAPYGEKLSGEEIAGILRDEAREHDIPDNVTYVGIDLLYGKKCAVTSVGDMANTYNDTCRQVYHQNKYEEYEEKGKSK